MSSVFILMVSFRGLKLTEMFDLQKTMQISGFLLPYLSLISFIIR